MSITYFPFTPVPNTNFVFQPTLDGEVYNVVVTWNFAAQRYYINIYSLDGTLIVSRAMVGSPIGTNLSALSWANGTVTATMSAPIPYRIGSSVQYTVVGSVPDAYNGQVVGYVTSPTTFTYPLAADPGVATVLGNVSQNINLIFGYFQTSSLVYRTATSQFEVSP